MDLTAFSALQPLLPYTYSSKTDTDRVFHVTALALEYAATGDSSSSSPQPNYIAELKRIAYQSGHRFEDVLKTVMSQIGQQLHIAGADGNFGDNDKDNVDYDDDDEDEEDGEKVKEEKEVDKFTAAQSVHAGPQPGSLCSLSSARSPTDQGV